MYNAHTQAFALHLCNTQMGCKVAHMLRCTNNVQTILQQCVAQLRARYLQNKAGNYCTARELRLQYMQMRFIAACAA